MTAWSRAGSSYVCECRPGYEAVVELSGACAYAAPWGTVERAEGAVLTVVEQATGLAVAKRLRIAGDATWRRRRRRQEGVRCAHRRGGGQGRGSRDQGMAPRRARRHPLGGRAGIARRSGAPAVARPPGRRAGARPASPSPRPAGTATRVLARTRPRLGRRGIGPLPDAVRGLRASPNGSSIRECRRRAARTTTARYEGSTPATWKPIRARTWTSS
ncbi:MAG: hypothetical protein ACLSVD_12465 [Eggerthellaceae bacterium]